MLAEDEPSLVDLEQIEPGTAEARGLDGLWEGRELFRTEYRDDPEPVFRA